MQAQEQPPAQARLIIEKSMKSIMIGRKGGTIRRVKRFADVHIAKFSHILEQAIIKGQQNGISDAIHEFISRLILLSLQSF